MKIKHMLMIIAILSVAACAVSMNVQQQFSQSYIDYNNYLRWSEFDRMKMFMSEKARSDFAERIRNGSDIKISDVRELRVDYGEGKDKAEVEVEVEYFRYSAGSVKKVIYLQEWTYVEEKDGKAWRITTLPPEFK